MHLKIVLESFSQNMSLHINFDKSTLVSIHVSASEASSMAALLGCPVATFPQTYLGLPLSVTKLKLADM